MPGPSHSPEQGFMHPAWRSPLPLCPGSPHTARFTGFHGEVEVLVTAFASVRRMLRTGPASGLWSTPFTA